jgi:hypothetical protein
MIDRTLITRSLGPIAMDWRVSASWNAKIKNHRALIRQDIVNSLAVTDDLIQKNLLNLKELPTAPGVDISVSHCPVLGGYAWAGGGYKIGFDIEQNHRVRADHVLMVASQDELKMAQEPSNLWVIKESAFKAFSKAYNVNVASLIEVQNVTHSEGAGEFTASIKAYPHNFGHGWFFRHHDCTLALFFLKS